MFPDLLTDIVDYNGDLYRNIRSPREPIDCYDDLGDGDVDTQIAVSAEMIGHDSSHAPVITRPFDYGVIPFPFVREEWQKTRFSDGLHYGVFYGSEALETTVYETVHHWQRWVMDAYAERDEEIVSERRAVLVLCRGLLVNLIGKGTAYPALFDPTDYTFTNQVGRYLKDQNQNGLLVRSARCDGTNAAIFAEEILSNPRDLCSLTYRWNPARSAPVRIERDAGTTWLTI